MDAESRPLELRMWVEGEAVADLFRLVFGQHGRNLQFASVSEELLYLLERGGRRVVIVAAWIVRILNKFARAVVFLCRHLGGLIEW